MSESPNPDVSNDMTALLAIMKKLRDPVQGCEWDRAQDWASLAKYTIEEAYEIAQSAEQGDVEGLKDELGDLLFHVTFYAQIAAEKGDFDFDLVVQGVCEKLIRRHPHVFSGARVKGEKALKAQWEQIKQKERLGKSDCDSILDSVLLNLPALTRAKKLQSKAAHHGFDWPDFRGPMKKIEEELEELGAALEENNKQHIQAEIGDLLFSVVNLCRHVNVDPETALRVSNEKFIRRFRYVEHKVADSGKAMSDHDLKTLDSYWGQAKQKEAQ